MQTLDWAEITRLKDEEGLSFSQIGQRLGKTKGSVYNAYRRAKAAEAKPSAESGSPPSKPEPVAAKTEGSAQDEVKDEAKAAPQDQPESAAERKLRDLLPDLQEIASWWQKHKPALKTPQAPAHVSVPFKWLVLFAVAFIGLLIWGMSKRKGKD